MPRNMSKSPLWYDQLQNRAFNFKGLKQVRFKLIRKEKLGYFVILSAMTDGIKQEPVIIFEGLEDVPNFKFRKEAVVTVAVKGTTAHLMNRYR